MELSRREYWSGLPFSAPRESSQPRNQSCISALAGRQIFFFTTVPPGSPHHKGEPAVNESPESVGAEDGDTFLVKLLENVDPAATFP